MYIHETKNWNNFKYDSNKVLPLLSQVRLAQGKLLGKMENLGFSLKEEKLLSTITLDVLKSSEIEGLILNKQQVRSSVARRLGLKVTGLVRSERNVDGVVEMMIDATQNYKSELTEQRLFGWHAALFQTGWSGMVKINVGQYRKGDMQVVSGVMGKETIHFEAPKAERVPSEMKIFLDWINNDSQNSKIDDVIKSAIAHLWFVTIHPFDDGNGRIARAITDMLLSRSDGSQMRFYSMSNEILNNSDSYYDILEKTQHGTNEITEWIIWFLNCLLDSINESSSTMNSILIKTEFWQNNSNVDLNERQRLMLNKLLDGFTGKLNSSKWAKIAKCSSDSALRDINDLVSKNILCKEASGGRSTSYILYNSLIEVNKNIK